MLSATSLYSQKRSKEEIVIEDSVDIEPIETVFDKPTSDKVEPKVATRRSAIIPGWGQITNKKYWKLPIIYGGISGLVYGFTWNNSHFNDALDIYIILNKSEWTEEEEQEIYDHVNSPSIDLSNPDHVTYVTTLVDNQKDYYRRNRDLNVVGLFVLYVVNIIDANVDAHLADFDISDDISMNIQPAIDQTKVGVTLKFRLRN